MSESLTKTQAEGLNSKISEIIRGRLTGKPVTKISQDTGVSRQYIYGILSRLPRDSAAIPERPAFPVEVQYDLVMEYLRRSSGNMAAEEQKALAEKIAGERGLAPEAVYKTLCRLTSRHTAIAHYPYYSNIERWERDHMISLQSFIEGVGSYRAKLYGILRGWDHMPLELARRIQEYSGLSITEIYADLIALDKEARIEESEEN